MKLLAKASVIVLAALAYLAPLTEIAHCEGDHEAACATGCACVCDCVPALACHEQAGAPLEREPERACFADLPCSGILSVADIFRPPTAV